MNTQAKPKKKKILVIDDDEDLRSALEKRLFTQGFDVITAANGKHAFQKMQSGNEFDLILCDLKMPVMDGVTFVKEARNMGYQGPIIAMSGKPDRESIMALANRNLAGFFLKPFKPNDLLAKIRDTLGMPGSDKAAA